MYASFSISLNKQTFCIYFSEIIVRISFRLNTYVYIYMCVCVCVRVCACVCVSLFIFMYVLYVCMYVCVVWRH